MMYLPDLFGDDLFDDELNFEDAFNDLDRQFTKEISRKDPLYGKHAKNLMKTDVREEDGNYVVSIDLPGFKKDEIKLSLKDGYLNIETNKSLDRNEKDKKGRLVRKERYAGNLGRSFYVGNGITEKDVHAKYENGVLTITLPKRDHEELDNQSISIE